MPGFVYALIAHGIIGRFDVIYNHELLAPSEGAAHVLLFVNFGVIVALLGQALLAWLALPTGVVPTSHGMASWILSDLALGALGWSVRDALSAARRTAEGAPRGFSALHLFVRMHGENRRAEKPTAPSAVRRRNRLFALPTST